MCTLDDRIMDHLAATARSSPAAIAAGPPADVTRELIAERCRLLARVGFIAPLHGDAYEITGLGERSDSTSRPPTNPVAPTTRTRILECTDRYVKGVRLAYCASSPVSESTNEPTGVARELDESGLGPGAMAAMGSVALALYYYYVRGEKQRGQFVWLWPATILDLAVYLKLDQMKQMLHDSGN